MTTTEIDWLVESFGSVTNYPRDRAKVAIILRGIADLEPAERDRVRGFIKAKRRAWLDWLTVTQRKWQAHTRRPSRARHHDSIRTRDGYVRCHAGDPA